MELARLPAPDLGFTLELGFEGDVLADARFLPPGGEAIVPNRWAALVARHLETGREDLSVIPADLGGVPPFEREALEALRRVRAGATITYGELAQRVGRGSARAVGTAMARNPLPIVVPCHRVLPATGELGNYSGLGGTATKLALLRLEGARF